MNHTDGPPPTPGPGERGFSEDPRQEYPNRPPDRPGPATGRTMPWWGWLILGLALCGLVALAAILWAAVQIGQQDAQPADDPPAVAQPEPSPEPTAEATGEDGVTASHRQRMRDLNEQSDDPDAPGDEVAYLDHIMDNDMDTYRDMNNANLLGMGLTVCKAFDAGHSVIEVIRFFPDEFDGTSRGVFIAAATFYLCDEHRPQVEREVLGTQEEQ